MRNYLKQVLCTFSILTIIFSQAYCERLSPDENLNRTRVLWPIPKKITINLDAQPLRIDFCEINFKITATPPDGVQQALNIYLHQVFGCRSDRIVKKENESPIMNIVVKNPNKMTAEKVED